MHAEVAVARLRRKRRRGAVRLLPESASGGQCGLEAALFPRGVAPGAGGGLPPSADDVGRDGRRDGAVRRGGRVAARPEARMPRRGDARLLARRGVLGPGADDRSGAGGRRLRILATRAGDGHGDLLSA